MSSKRAANAFRRAHTHVANLMSKAEFAEVVIRKPDLWRPTLLGQALAWRHETERRGV